MGMFLLLISLSSCNFLIYGDLKLELGAPTVIRCNEDKIKYEVSLESINNEESYYTYLTFDKDNDKQMLGAYLVI